MGGGGSTPLVTAPGGGLGGGGSYTIDIATASTQIPLVSTTLEMMNDMQPM